ncbi:hypothetical protein B7R22_18415 [Subtercola boreus]|uniref:Uncharacterized protein n=1 Tax=Subtercola boreus TaxID=120213 RepID=A0A3E0VPZ7_9MICO|nr:hypothetical protein [Subtercola boreus]RFA11689.1 hypothetical protein B7R22_18415 [Subtercola boreus]
MMSDFGVSRRTVVKSAAWAVPVISLAVAAPAAAASGAGSIAFSPATYLNPSGLGYTALTGTVTATAGGVLPAQLAVVYSAGFSGPETTEVDPSTGNFTITNVTSPDAVATGTITATASGYGTGTATLSVTNPEPRSGSISFNPTQYHGTRNGNRVDFPVLTGTVSVTGGPLPDTVILSFSAPDPGRVDLKRDAGLTVPIDPITGAFSVDGVYNSIVGGDNPFGFIYAGVQNPGTISYGQATGELDG